MPAKPTAASTTTAKYDEDTLRLIASLRNVPGKPVKRAPAAGTSIARKPTKRSA